jgi:hypothetical protein
MTLMEQIKEQLSKLPPEKQSEVLDFITFLQQRVGLSKSARNRSLKKHAAFGSWKHRNINAIQYQQNLRSEWGK